MSPKKRKIILAISLVAAVFYTVNFYASRRPSSQSQNVEMSAATVATTLQAQTGQPAKMSESAVNEEQGKAWGPDPFRSRKATKLPTTTVETATNSWSLSGIVLSGGRPMAIINSRGVGEGDLVSGAKVVRIEAQQVIMEYAGKTFTLTVNKG